MVSLSDTIKWITPDSGSTVIARVDSKALTPSALPQLLLANSENINRIASGQIQTSRYKAVVIPEKLSDAANWKAIGTPVALLCESLAHLSHDDVVRIEGGTNRTRVLFKRSFRHNSLLITERCNNYCVMCSQPPRDIDDEWVADELFTIAALIPKDTVDIGITGGEPTLLGEKLLSLIKLFKNQLPSTALHILSNGRKFSDAAFAKQCGSIGHHDLMFGIPLYGDNYIDHDYVVQAEGGFAEAVQGIANLKRSGVKVEIRCVIHRDTVDNLVGLATFITRNLTFVDHVALMGYEAMGFGKSNAKQLFVLPDVFMRQLNAAIHLLHCAKIRTSVYNLPLCLTSGRARDLSVQSISDWKNEYLPECDGCRSRHQCAGFFTSTKELYRHHVRPE
jgi:His-Xaa-Ser system radical SAM maturase HxsC